MSDAPRPVPTPLGSHACDVAVAAAEDASSSLSAAVQDISDDPRTDEDGGLSSDLLEERVSKLEYAEAKVAEAMERCQEESRHG